MGEKKNEGKFEPLRTIVIAGLIAVGFRSFLFEPFNIPSRSMMPTFVGWRLSFCYQIFLWLLALFFSVWCDQI